MSEKMNFASPRLGDRLAYGVCVGGSGSGRGSTGNGEEAKASEYRGQSCCRVAPMALTAVVLVEVLAIIPRVIDTRGLS